MTSHIFVLMSFVVLVFIALQIYFNDYKKPSILYSLSLITIFYTPALYFEAGGEVYRFFSDDSLLYFEKVSLCVFMVNIVINVFAHAIKTSSGSIVFGNSRLVFFYFLFFISIILAYYIYFAKSMPLFNFLTTGEIVERPDLTGNIPNFYTMSSLVMVFLGSCYFYYFYSITRPFYHVLISMLISIIFIASGHKGFIVYYFIFIWLFVLRCKIDMRIVLIFFLLMFVYMLSKGLTTIDRNTLEYMASSPFRRFFVTQGTGFIHRIDMVADNLSFTNVRGIKFDVFPIMYNDDTLIGSAPTFYMGDIFVKHGIFVSFGIFALITSIIIFSTKFLHQAKSNKKLFIYWNIYVCIYLLSMAEISISSSLRIVLALGNFFTVYILSKISIKPRVLL